MTVTIATPETLSPLDVLREYGSRPVRVNKKTGVVQVHNQRGMLVNSLLTKDEWESMERKVFQAAALRTNVLNLLRASGLVMQEDLGTIVSQWNTASEMTAANESINGQSAGERDRVDFKLVGVTVPIIFKEFQIGTRQLRSSRLMSNPIDTIHATQAARVVAEKIESIIIDGANSKLNAAAITYGLTNHPNRKTDTATNYGGGDWGTIGNAVKTVAGMITALSNSTNRYHGPFQLLVAPTQYNQAANTYYTDGSGQTDLDRILNLTQIAGVQPNDTLADGEAVLFQPTEDVIDYSEQMAISVVEWMSPDGMASNFKVVAAGAPRIKADYGSRSGVCHATGC
jgi:uncharacterized linocin/CFP29 family protein